MTLTQEELNILAHVVIDPQAWADHASATVGEDSVRAKIEKYRADYLAESVKPGYMNRAQREAQS